MQIYKAESMFPNRCFTVQHSTPSCPEPWSMHQYGLGQAAWTASWSIMHVHIYRTKNITMARPWALIQVCSTHICMVQCTHLITTGTWDTPPVIRSRTRQNFELVHIIGPVQNFGPPARNFGPLRAEFAWREWRKTLGGHVANWAGLSGFSPRENKISHTFFIDRIDKYSKVSNAHNSDDCHGVFNGGMLNKGWSFSR